MKLEGKLKGDLKRVEIKSNNANDGTEALVDVAVSMTEDDAKRLVGEDFAKIAFSTMRVIEDEDGGQAFGFLIDTVKPGKKVAWEKHKITIGGAVVDTIPKVFKIAMVQGTERVIVSIRIPLDADGKAVKKLVGEVSKVIDMEFNPVQQSLPGTLHAVS